jgi:flavin reductase (DIM6/NTAB) family NADH-FMN oxidoreductase RutF
MQQHFDLPTMQNWDRFYRTNFINSLSGFKSASLIGTANESGQTNLAIFSNIVHIGADPALIGFINRPREAAPHSIQNIEATKQYTINHIQASMIDAAHQTSAKYAEGESEFDAVGLTVEWKANCKAPFVLESKVKYSMQLKDIIPILINKTFLVIGAVQEVYVEETIVSEDGFLQIDEAGSICSLGIDGYYETNLLKRIAYAKK